MKLAKMVLGILLIALLVQCCLCIGTAIIADASASGSDDDIIDHKERLLRLTQDWRTSPGRLTSSRPL